jgi:hypothetical protein
VEDRDKYKYKQYYTYIYMYIQIYTMFSIVGLLEETKGGGKE